MDQLLFAWHNTIESITFVNTLVIRVISPHNNELGGPSGFYKNPPAFSYNVILLWKLTQQ